MFTRTADGVLVFYREQTVMFWNRAAERLLGYLSDEVLGRPCSEVMCGETLAGKPLCPASCTIARCINCGDTVRNFEMQTHTKNGRLLWLNTSSLPIPSGVEFWERDRLSDQESSADVWLLVGIESKESHESWLPNYAKAFHSSRDHELA